MVSYSLENLEHISEPGRRGFLEYCQWIFHFLLPLPSYLSLTFQPHCTICCYRPCSCLVSELTHTVPSFWKTAFPSILSTTNPALVSSTTRASFKVHLRSYLHESFAVSSHWMRISETVTPVTAFTFSCLVLWHLYWHCRGSTCKLP